MQRNQQQQQPDKFGMKDSFHLTYLVAHSHALCITPFIRNGFGVRAFGLPVVLAIVMIFIYGAVFPAPEMVNYFWVWLLAVIIQRARSFKADWQGQSVHSGYQGWPWLAMRLPFVKQEGTAKLIVEPLICLAVGLCICPLSKAIGDFVCVGFLSLLFTAGVQREFWRARARRMRDAQIEQQELMRMFNQTRDDF